MKKVLQFLGSALYSCITCYVLYLLVNLPVAWLFSLPIFWRIVVYLFMFGLIEGVMSMIASLLSFPYTWLLKDNLAATIIASLLIVFGAIRNSIVVWVLNCHGGFWHILFCLMATIWLITLSGVMLSFFFKARGGEFE